MSKIINIVKKSGEVAPFSKTKVERSLRRSGASAGLARDIAIEVENKIKPGMSTGDIYNLAFRLLKDKKRGPVAARYSLKKAINELGPTGFPFEKFIGEIFKRKDFKVEVGKVVKGKCVSHEVDVVAKKGNKHYFMECKFHGRQAKATDVKVALYVHSRFRDIMDRIDEQGICHEIHKAWVITNTRLSKDAIRYGECNGMKMIGWKYPKDRGVEVLIEETALHPVTCLTTITDEDKRNLLAQDIVLCKDVPEKINVLKTLGIDSKKITSILKEVEGICGDAHK